MELEHFKPWLDKTVVLDFDTGGRTTARILRVDTSAVQSAVTLEILESNRAYPDQDRRAYDISYGLVLSVHPALDAVQARPVRLLPDECRESVLTPENSFFAGILRFMGVVMAFCIFLVSADYPGGLQIASLLGYTAAVYVLTFGRLSYQQRYLLHCPIVRLQRRRLLRRHFGYSVALLAIVTAALSLRPRLSSSWLTESGRGASPFILALLIICGVLALVQGVSNRSLLDRAHLAFSMEDAGSIS
jgi:hypothetical protein